MPEYAIQEVLHHAPMIRKRTGLSMESFDLLVALLTSRIDVVPEAQLRPWIPKANLVLGHRDPGDVPFLAAAYEVPCDGLWLDDADFQVVLDIPIWTTKALIKHLGL